MLYENLGFMLFAPWFGVEVSREFSFSQKREQILDFQRRRQPRLSTQSQQSR
jgi:hypothetical protein